MMIDVAKVIERTNQYSPDWSSDPMACPQDKRTYESRKLAMTAGNRRLHSKRGNPGNIRAYFCQTCNGWHLTAAKGK